MSAGPAPVQKSDRFFAAEIDGDDAAWLRGQLPPHAQLHERMEVDFFGRAFVEQPSGLLVPDHLDPVERFMREKVEAAEATTPRPVGVDLFAGAGGFSLGVHQAGFDVLAAAEWDPIAASTYLLNLGHPECDIHYVGEGAEERWKREEDRARKRQARKGADPHPFPDGDWIGSAALKSRGQQDRGCRAFFMGDVAELDGEQITEAIGRDDISCVFGGPPCQGLSTANAKACLEDPRNGMLWEFLRLVAELEPRSFIIENVPQILTVAGGALFEAICKRANDVGYDVVAQKINAAWYGVPQNRVRALIVGTEHGKRPFQFPMPTHWGLGRSADGRRWTIGGDEDQDEALAAEFDEETGQWSVRGEEPEPSPQQDLGL